LILGHTPLIAMRNSILVFLFLGSHAFAGEWVLAQGGLSPDKRLAVAVFPQKTELIDEANDTVLLIVIFRRKRGHGKLG